MKIGYKSLILLFSLKIIDKGFLFLVSILIFNIDKYLSDDFLFYNRVTALGTVALSFGIKQIVIRQNLNFKQIGLPLIAPIILSLFTSLFFLEYTYLFIGISLNAVLITMSSVLLIKEKIKQSIIFESLISNASLLLIFLFYKNISAFELIFYSRLIAVVFVLSIYFRKIDFDITWFNGINFSNFYFQNLSQSIIKNIDAFVIRKFISFGGAQSSYFMGIYVIQLLQILQEVNNKQLLSLINKKNLYPVKKRVRELSLITFSILILTTIFIDKFFVIFLKYDLTFNVHSLLVVAFLGMMLNIMIGPAELYMNLHSKVNVGSHIKIIVLLSVICLGFATNYTQSIIFISLIIFISYCFDNILRHFYLKSKNINIHA